MHSSSLVVSEEEVCDDFMNKKPSDFFSTHSLLNVLRILNTTCASRFAPGRKVEREIKLSKFWTSESSSKLLLRLHLLLLLTHLLHVNSFYCCAFYCVL